MATCFGNTGITSMGEKVPAKQNIDWSKLRKSVCDLWYRADSTLASQFPSPWLAWNCDEHTRGNPLPDGLLVEVCLRRSTGLWKTPSKQADWCDVVSFRIVGIQEGWE